MPLEATTHGISDGLCSHTVKVHACRDARTERGPLALLSHRGDASAHLVFLKQRHGFLKPRRVAPATALARSRTISLRFLHLGPILCIGVDLPGGLRIPPAGTTMVDCVRVCLHVQLAEGRVATYKCYHLVPSPIARLQRVARAVGPRAYESVKGTLLESARALACLGIVEIHH